MDFAARHAGFVIASYAVAFVLVGGLVTATLIRYRAVRRRLEELERLGAPRRRKAEDGSATGDRTEEQPA